MPMSLSTYEVIPNGSTKRRSSSRACSPTIRLAVVGVAALMLVLIAAIAVYLYATVLNANTTCTSRSCVRASAMMLDKMNTSADPCDDFFEFACGRWVADVTPAIKTPQWNVVIATGIDALSQLAKRIDQLLLHAPTLPVNNAEAKAVSLYSSCINEERLRQVGLRPWLEFVQSIGGWHPHENYIPQSLEQVLMSVYNRSTYPLIWIGSLIDDKNTSNHVVTIDEPVPSLIYVALYRTPPLPVERESLLSGNCSEFLKALYEMSVYMATGLLNVEPSIELNSSIADMVEFEWRTVMAGSAVDANKSLDNVYYSTDLQTMSEIAPFLNWTLFLGDLYKGVEINKEEKIVVKKGTEWLMRLNAVMEEYQSTERGRRTIENYVKWRSILFHLQYSKLDCSQLPRGMQLYFQRFLFNFALSGHRHLYCLLRATNLLPNPFASIFRKIMPGKEQKNKEMVKQIREHVKDTFKEEVSRENDWLDEVTKSSILNKLDSMQSLVSYPESIFDEKAMESRHQHLRVNSEDMFWSMVNASRFSRLSDLRRLRQPVVRLAWLDNTSPLTINALYNFERNVVILPMMITRPPFADSAMPMLFNYASIGSIIGHEMSHAFDITGRQHDQNGNLRDTWSDQSITAFGNRSQCFVEQYSEFTKRGYQIDADETLMENIGDNAGLKLAYKAWKSQEPDISFRLPGTDFTVDQAFFVAYAQTWCGKNDAQRKLHADVHSIDSLRVLGPVQNSAPFARAFRCAVGSPMNPQKKCDVW